MPGSVLATIVSSIVGWALILGTAAAAAAATTTTTTNQSRSTTKQQQHSQLRQHGPVVAEDTTTRRRTQQHAFSSPFAPGGILNPTTMDGQHDFVRDGPDSTELMGRQDLSPEPIVLPCGSPGAKATLYNLLCSESEFSFFCGPNQYRDNFGVVDLNNFTAHYTFWAPTNQAWQTLLSTGDPKELDGSFTNLLEYHVSEGLHYQKDLQCGANTTSVFFEQPHHLQCRDHAVDPEADHSTLNGPDYEVGTLNTNPDYLPKYDASTYNPDVADNAFIRGCNGIIYTLNNVMLPDFSLTPVPTTSPVPHVSCSPSLPSRTSGPTLPPTNNISFPPSSQRPSRGPSAAPSSTAPTAGPTLIPHISCNPTTAQPTVAPHISCNPTAKPTLGPTPAIVTNAPTTTPSGMPTPAPFDASALGGMSGIAAPFPTIDTVADFNIVLSFETFLILAGIPLRRQLQTFDEAFSGCRYQPRSEQIVASSPECTQYFPSVAGEFCYRFELFITQQDPPSDTLCPINAAIERIIDAADNGEYANGGTGNIVDAKVVRFVETAAPSLVPTLLTPTEPPTNEAPVPTGTPTEKPITNEPTEEPSNQPTELPSNSPTPPRTPPPAPPPTTQSDAPSQVPSDQPSTSPSKISSNIPSQVSSDSPSVTPSEEPTNELTLFPTFGPTFGGSTTGPTSGVTTTGPTTSTTNENARTASANTCGNDGSPKSILDYVCWMDNFSLLCKALHRVGMTRLFSGADINGNLDSTTTFTLFVPVNEAMIEAGLTFDTIEEIDDEILQNIIKSHIMIGSMKVEDLICGAQYKSMLSSTIGEDDPVYSQSLLKVDCMTVSESKTKSISGFYNTDLKNQPTMLSPNDIRLCNGYVQPIYHIIQS